MTCLRPRVAEIQIDSFKAVRSENLFQMNRVTAKKTNVVHLAVFDFFRRDDHDVTDLFNGDKSDIGISVGNAGNKSALAAADLDAEALFIGE